MPSFLRLGLSFGVGIAVAQEVTNSTLQFSWTRPRASVPLPPDLCGFSIEADRWPDWAGNVTHRNNFTYTILDNLRLKTGVAPPIRVGGGTQEGVVYYPDFPSDPGYYSVFPAVAPGATGKQLFPEASLTEVGFNYYLCAGNLPNGTSFTWGINLAQKNMSETVAQVQVLDRAFADPYCENVRLNNIEMGNEFDSSLANITVYTDLEVEYFNAINAALGNNGRKYRLGDFAKYWTTAELLATGILNSTMGPSINTFSEHHYQTDASVSGQPSGVYGAAEDLILKANIRNNLLPYNQSVNNANTVGIPFVLGETGTFSGHGLADVSNTAAAALWMVDYSLQASTLGISSLHFHNGIGYNYSSFEPLDHIGINITDYSAAATRHVLPQYYGYLAVADAIGDSGRAYINELTTDNSNLAAYQIWEGCSLERIMLINGVSWTNVTAEARPMMAVNIPALADWQGVTYKVLNISSIDDLHGLTWGGQSWENYDGTATGDETYEPVGSDGTIHMQASSAVLVYL